MTWRYDDIRFVEVHLPVRGRSLITWGLSWQGVRLSDFSLISNKSSIKPEKRMWDIYSSIAKCTPDNQRWANMIILYFWKWKRAHGSLLFWRRHGDSLIFLVFWEVCPNYIDCCHVGLHASSLVHCNACKYALYSSTELLPQIPND